MTVSTRLVGAALAGLALVACSPSVVRQGGLNESITSSVVQDLASLRGLPFRKEVPMRVQKAETLREVLTRELYREYSPEELEALQRLYRFIGLLSEDSKLVESLLDLYTAQVAGFYDPRSETLFLVESSRSYEAWWTRLLGTVLRRDLAGELFLAHELTHALQDQHTSILARTRRPRNDDAALAARAVAEGDASLTGFAFVLGGLGEDVLPALVQGLQTLPAKLASSIGDVPPIVREPLLFQYVNGGDFVARAYRAGGWPAVDAVLAHPPSSTEQVLWPDKFYVDRDDPRRISLGGLDAYRKGDTWRQIEENTFGELFIRILVQRFLGPDQAVWVGLGWDGDRFAAFERDEDIHFFWMTVWDSERDAREFFDASRSILEARFEEGTAAVGNRTDGGGVARGGEAVPWFVEQRRDRVLVVAGPRRDAMTDVVVRLWAGTSVAPDGVFRNLPLDLAELR